MTVNLPKPAISADSYICSNLFDVTYYRFSFLYYKQNMREVKSKIKTENSVECRRPYKKDGPN